MPENAFMFSEPLQRWLTWQELRELAWEEAVMERMKRSLPEGTNLEEHFRRWREQHGVEPASDSGWTEQPEADQRPPTANN